MSCPSILTLGLSTTVNRARLSVTLSQVFLSPNVGNGFLPRLWKYLNQLVITHFTLDYRA